MRDFYQVLGVDRSASQEEIKQAFRRLAREHHPDVRKDDPQADERFKEINEAYQILSDPQRRAQYDRFGTVERMPVDNVPGEGFGPFGDIFDMFFGRRATREERDAPEAGADLRYDLELSLEEAATGVERTIEIERLETCPRCFGTGAERGSAPEQCPTCQGRGEVRRSQRTVFGSFTQISTCHTCGGTGTILRHPCTQCRGSGRAAVKRAVSVSIPPGVDSGMRLRIAGEGESGLRGGPRGDLYVFLHMHPHPIFLRQGKDLDCTVPITIYQAALGDDVEVPTLEGPITRTIPPGVQPGTVITVRGKGMPDARGHRGDLHVRLDVRVPTDLTDEERTLLRRLAALRGHDVKPQRGKTISSKVKDLLQ